MKLYNLGCTGWFGILFVLALVASGLYFVIEGLAWVEGTHAPDVALETATSFFALGLFVDLVALWWRDDSGESPVPTGFRIRSSGRRCSASSS